MLDIFHYGFIVRGLGAGALIALIAPLIGIFLVLKRYSLFADTLSHASLAGVAVGLLLKINPIITTIIASLISSFAIERLRASTRVYGETALALFLSGGLALAVVLISAAHGFNVDLFSYLFGSIVTVTKSDVAIISTLSVIVIAALAAFYKELMYISFDEEAAKVSGIRTKMINNVFILLAAITVALAIPIIGILLISALMVIPVVTALQFKCSFKNTIATAEIVSLFSMLSGIITSFYYDLAPGGIIVLIMLAIFILTLIFHRDYKSVTLRNNAG